MNTTSEKTTTTRPELAFYHPNAKGTGSAVKMSLHPAVAGADGYIDVTMANQKTVGGLGILPTFDLDNAGHFAFSFDAVCKILQVLRGECESIDDGKGLYQREETIGRHIVFRHVLEPVCGYSFEVYECAYDRQDHSADFQSRIFFSPSEALGLASCFEIALYAIAFGISDAAIREA